MSAGHVASLHRWPVKSMAGEDVDALTIDRLGAAGDRAHALFAEFRGAPRRITAEGVPRLLAWAAAYPVAADAHLSRDALPQPLVTAPDGTGRAWDDPALPAALAADLGREVTLAREPDGQQDRPRTVHVTIDASVRALEAELGAQIDVRRFRPNIHLMLDADPYAEEGWIGRRMQIGDAVLVFEEGCERCAIPTRDPRTQEKWPQLLRHLAAQRSTIFGLIARSLGPAVVRPGDRAQLL
ncbi:MAG TPA: MOSC domain-containing protein [Solirubrobacteraceae bacterium]|nr:MOSC domain-containing protein [Solirubrobacteraceae bacterium]